MDDAEQKYKSFDYLQELTPKGMILIFLMQNNVYLWGRKPQDKINYSLGLEKVSQTMSWFTLHQGDEGVCCIT